MVKLFALDMQSCAQFHISYSQTFLSDLQQIALAWIFRAVQIPGGFSQAHEKEQDSVPQKCGVHLLHTWLLGDFIVFRLD